MDLLTALSVLSCNYQGRQLPRHPSAESLCTCTLCTCSVGAFVEDCDCFLQPLGSSFYEAIMAENPEPNLELDTFNENISYLEQTLCGNVQPILHKLNEKGLIKHDAYDKVKEIQSLLTSEQKAGLIVASLRDVIKLSADRYHELIEVLSDKEVANYFRDGVKKLKKPFYGRLNNSDFRILNMCEVTVSGTGLE